ncbi:hypothetical protein MSTO_51160 [Mycobacterium stomatepiae]|uniref:Uncharacterized protein n=1 Tax=Mycobacterium stomatepiae TaxID=470076 RepID=A0A7I7QFC0_9MYCO|nr:hypothetical protein MSTO_51160 [Mycobacterium stomatepiae]
MALVASPLIPSGAFRVSLIAVQPSEAGGCAWRVTTIITFLLVALLGEYAVTLRSRRSTR